MSFPIIDTVERRVEGQATAATDDSFEIDTARFNGAVISVTYTPDAAITGAPAHNRTLSVINKGQTGAGTVSIASLTTTANLAAHDENALTLSATVADRNVVAGDVLMFNSDANSAGVIDPGGLVVVKIQRS
jgi:hypothetical protein